MDSIDGASSLATRPTQHMSLVDSKHIITCCAALWRCLEFCFKNANHTTIVVEQLDAEWSSTGAATIALYRVQKIGAER